MRCARVMAMLASACGRTGVDASADVTSGAASTSAADSGAGVETGSSSVAATSADASSSSDGAERSEDGEPLPDVPASCGDGVLADGERCDDGNAIPADGCNPDCEPSGAPRWRVDVPGIDLSDWAVHERLAVAADGAIVVVGPGFGTDAPARLHVLADDGSTLAEHDFAADARPLGVAFTTDGVLAIAGDVRQGNGPRRAWLEARDGVAFETFAAHEVHEAHGLSIAAFAPASAGRIAWALDAEPTRVELVLPDATVVSSLALADTAIDTLALDPIRGELVASGSFPEGTDVARWSAAGELLWSLDLQPLTTHAVVDRIAVAASGDAVLLAGHFAPPADQLGIVVLDRDGAIRWRHENYELGAIDDAHELPSARDVAIDPTGDIVVAGWASRSAGGADPWVLKLDAAGDVRWQALVPGPGDDARAYDFGLMVATAPDGTIVLAGRRDTAVGDVAWLAALAP